MFRENINKITSIPALSSWIITHSIDTTNNIQRIYHNAAALISLLENIKIDPATDANFTQKLFLKLLDIAENKSPRISDVPQEATPQHRPRGLPASYAIPLKKLKKYVPIEDIREYQLYLLISIQHKLPICLR
ncbi:MAG: hypothetical protein V4501_00870 [Pseudomonadota bacterium]